MEADEAARKRRQQRREYMRENAIKGNRFYG